jgi:hypothetical protein
MARRCAAGFVILTAQGPIQPVNLITTPASRTVHAERFQVTNIGARHVSGGGITKEGHAIAVAL